MGLKKKEHYTTTFAVILNRIIEIVQNSAPRFFPDVKLLLLQCSYILVEIATCAPASLAKDKHFIRITYLNTCSQTVCGWYCLLNSFQFLSFMGSHPYTCAACTVTRDSISDRWPVIHLLCELFTKPPWAYVSAEVQKCANKGTVIEKSIPFLSWTIFGSSKFSWKNHTLLLIRKTLKQVLSNPLLKDWRNAKDLAVTVTHRMAAN